MSKLIWRISMWLNLYGCQAVQHRSKTGKKCVFSVFWVGHFGWGFFSIFFHFFASSPWKSVKRSCVARMGQNFDDYLVFWLFLTQGKHFCPECITVMFFTRIMQFQQIFQILFLCQFLSVFFPAMNFIQLDPT